MIMMRVSVECEHSLDVKMANRTNLNLTLKPMEASNLYRRRMEEHLRPAEHYALGPMGFKDSEKSALDRLLYELTMVESPPATPIKTFPVEPKSGKGKTQQRSLPPLPSINDMYAKVIKPKVENSSRRPAKY